MNLKYTALIAGIMLALGYIGGRYIQPPKVETKIQIQKEVEVQEKVHTVTKIVERKDGTKETIIDEDKEKNTQSDSTKNSDTLVERSRPRSNFSLMLGLQPKLFGGISPGAVTAGVSWQTQPISFIPVTLGFWGFAIPTPTMGVNLGWNF
jgi:hypothetical protein